MSYRWMILPVDPQKWDDPNSAKPKPTSTLRINKNKFWEEFQKAFPDDPLGEGLELSIAETNNSWGYEGNQHYHYFSFSPYTENTYKFLLWLRQFVAEEYPLYIFATGDSNRLLYTKKTKDAELKAFLGYQD